jgi:hypothetical protein
MYQTKRSIADTPNKKMDSEQLTKEINDSGLIGIACVATSLVNDETIIISFDLQITEKEELSVTQLCKQHSGTGIPKTYYRSELETILAAPPPILDAKSWLITLTKAVLSIETLR